ncbi:NAD(P)/FAD-dependent oxidoreductase [Rhodococcus rhodnii]|uniref:Dihydrolipoyl dehydrogenase n=2 Tax=Rhodococcus rhodnii TaxID=38312 RepID=R7WKC1_9NOCA|nr:NAD(P)/FAD-dependent oxidoreductase [Rhodococcus rhodnii]EOM75753.1 dihydrolipoyl dehydrogenase [Rhodococcus rhodnii LMG 5362]TXG90166.1 NAD(P)/FAD-dependent oxidoreductase [Rhodococcus rhodnii]
MATEPATSSDEFDVIVIGGGPAGEVVAEAAIRGSERTAAIVERELLGGECSYWACMPSKALLHPGEVLRGAQHMGGVTAQGLDRAAVFARRDSFTHATDGVHDDSAQLEWARSAGIEVVHGDARVTGERVVSVDGRTLRARHAVVVATGTTAAIPPTPGLTEALPWISRDATAVREMPRRVAVIGGGVVACESATWLSDLGADVTLLVRGTSLLTNAEPFAGERVRDALIARGVTILFDTSARSVHRHDPRDTGVGRIHGGPVTLDLGGGEPLVVDEVIAATGRRPATSDIGLDRWRNDHGYLDADEHLTVDGTWLYAVGDANGRALLTHEGKYQARIAGDVIAARAEGRPLDGPRFRVRDGLVTQVVFTTPQLAAVGLTERQARVRGADVVVVAQDIEVAGAALARDDFAGRVQLVADRATRTLLGATFVGTEVAELVHAASIAVAGRVAVDDLWHAVPAYPTVSEVWVGLLDELRGAL